MQRLSRRTLDTVLAGVILPPEAALEAGVGIVHLGLGAFHRAHQALLTQRALGRRSRAPGRSAGRACAAPQCATALRPQDCLYTLIENDGIERRPRSSAASTRPCSRPRNGDGLLARLAAPSTRIVTLTVTEKGYCHNPATGDLDLDPSRYRGRSRRPEARRARRWAGWCAVSTGAGERRCRRAHRALLRQHGEQRPHPARPGRAIRRVPSTRASPPGSRTRSAFRAAWSTGSYRPPPRPRSTMPRRLARCCATRRR